MTSEKIILKMINNMDKSKDEIKKQFTVKQGLLFTDSYRFYIDKKKIHKGLVEKAKDDTGIQDTFSKFLNQSEWNGTTLFVGRKELDAYIKTNNLRRVNKEARAIYVPFGKEFVCYNAVWLYELLDICKTDYITMGYKAGNGFVAMVENDDFIGGLLPVRVDNVKEAQIYHAEIVDEIPEKDNVKRAKELDKIAFANTWAELIQGYINLVYKYDKDCEEYKKGKATFRRKYNKVKDYHLKPNGKTIVRETYEDANTIIDIVETIHGFGGIKLEMLGDFMWTSGGKKAHNTNKAILKKLGFKEKSENRYSRHYSGYFGHMGNGWTFAKIKNYYGRNEDTV